MKRFASLSLLASSLIVACWLGMMLVHESGHILAACLTGGKLQHLVFHPLAFSRTDVSPNPHPLIVAWGGSIFGAIAPATFSAILRAAHRRSYCAEMFAAFCLLANGCYIGLGSLQRIGDAGDMLRLGSPIWILWLFGLICIPAGLALFHRQGPMLGLTTRAKAADFWIAGMAAILLIVLGFLIDGR